MVITTDAGNADRRTERFTGLMGLDGTFRKSPPANYGINAAKGPTSILLRWNAGFWDTAKIQSWTLTFDGNKVTVNFEDTDGFKTELHGETSD